MTTTILVHGYSAESSQTDPASVAAIYGTLAADLTAAGAPTVSIDVSRYVSLDDGIGVDDISQALDRILRSQYPALLTDGFNAIIHSTGALVLRNWVRRFSPKPSPLKRLIHLAGANLGSGWAHIGESDLARWLRFIGQNGTERGLAVLDALELGSAWSIELHRYFLQDGQRMQPDYGIWEFNIVGTQSPPEWMIVPIRYGKEDGSDGVVRVAASNLNFNYLGIGPTGALWNIDWPTAKNFSDETTQASADGGTAEYDSGVFAGGYYELRGAFVPGSAANPQTIPLAIPYNCAHSTAARGIVSGTDTRAQVIPLILQALAATTAADYAQAAIDFNAVTASTFVTAAQPQHAANLLAGLSTALQDYLHDPVAQYNPHAQIIIRVFDQHGKAVPSPSVQLNSLGGNVPPTILINTLIEDAHQNNTSPNTTTYYIKTHDCTAGGLAPCLPSTGGVDLEIDCVDPCTQNVLYVPLRMRLSVDDLMQYVQPHRTTIFDVTLMRLASPDTFILYSTP